MLPSSTRLLAKDIDALLRILTERGWNPLFIRPRDRHESCDHRPLTKRQREVLILVGEGLSGNEIAGRLSISVSTVAFHKTGIRRKLNLLSIAG